MLRIDDLKEPPIAGDHYLVPCIIREYLQPYTERANELEWVVGKDGDLVLQGGCRTYYMKHLQVYPVINHLHNDRENGQDYYHYHVDYRFIQLIPSKREDSNLSITPKYHPYHDFAPWLRYDLRVNASGVDNSQDYKLEYHALRCIRVHQRGIAGNVNQAKLAHHCIKNGKCPHRGYDLSQVVHINNVITCPLHGLKFDRITNQLIK